MTWLLNLLHPTRRPGLAWPHALILCAVLASFLTAGIVGRQVVERQPVVQVLGPLNAQQRGFITHSETLAPNLGEVARGYIPPAYLMHMTNVRAIVSSYYDNEYGILNSQPVEDSDFLLPYAAQEAIILPGPSWVKYTYQYTGFVQGSGYYMRFGSPGSGRFAYLHVHGPFSFHAGQSLPGGTQVGYTGWPTSYAYSNNSCNDDASCAYDAHMCLVADLAAANWLYRLVYDPPVQPKPAKPHFPVKRWERYVTAHHKPAISYRYKGHTRRIAWYWWKHRKGAIDRACGGAASKEQWHPKGKYMRQTFGTGCTAYQWQSKGQPMKIVKGGKRLP